MSSVHSVLSFFVITNHEHNDVDARQMDLGIVAIVKHKKREVCKRILQRNIKEAHP
jgi:hypothetical protein